MRFINWTKRSLAVETRKHARLETEALVALSTEEAGELARELRAYLDTQSGAQSEEGRLDLPGGWTFFVKVRPADSRLLLAHPQHGEWVGTLALSRAHWDKVLAGLDSLSAAAPVSVSALQRLGGINNLEVTFVAKA